MDFKSEIKNSRNSPKPKLETQGIGFGFPDPQEMTNCHYPIPQISEEWNLPGNWHPYNFIYQEFPKVNKGNKKANQDSLFSFVSFQGVILLINE